MTPRQPIDDEALWMIIGLVVIIASFAWGFIIGKFA